MCAVNIYSAQHIIWSELARPQRSNYSLALRPHRSTSEVIWGKDQHLKYGFRTEASGCISSTVRASMLFICTYDWVCNPLCCSRHLLVHIYGLDLTDTLAVCTFNEPNRLVLVRQKNGPHCLLQMSSLFYFPPYMYDHKCQQIYGAILIH